MAIFSGKIIEAYYTNADNSTVEVIYKEGTQAISYYMPVDFTNQDFKELIAEHDTDKIAESTIQRNRNYAKQLSDLVDASIKGKAELKQKVSVEDFVKKILNFDADDKESQEIFFTMKVEIFEMVYSYLRIVTLNFVYLFYFQMQNHKVQKLPVLTNLH